MSEQAKVAVRPPCDICGEPAQYDANIGHGWANVCQHHFDQLNCKVGTGKGQRLIVDKENV